MQDSCSKEADSTSRSAEDRKSWWRRNYNQVKPNFYFLKCWIPGCTTSITFQSSRSAFACSLDKPGLAFFSVIIYSLFFLADSILARAYCNLRNDLNETNWKSFTCEMNSKSVISKMESCICEMKICNLRKEDSCCKLHQPEGWIGQFVTSIDCNHNLAYNINYN